MPVGWIYPSFQPIKINTKIRIEKPTLKDKAFTILLDLASPLRPSRIMKTNAEPKLTKIAKNAIATMNFISAIITLPRSRAFAWVTLAMLVGVAVTVRLGFWQLSRADQKQAIHAAVMAQQSAPVLSTETLLAQPELFKQMHRRVALQGKWLPEHTVYLDNRPMQGRAGFWVVTPFALNNDTTVLVQRGWIPRNSLDRTQLAPIETPLGPVRLEGRLAPAPSPLLSLAGTQEDISAASRTSKIRQNLDFDQMTAQTGVDFAATVLQTDPPSDGLLREWLEISAGVEKNHAYAFQWFALAAVQLMLYLWFQFITPYRHVRRSTP
jgi:surfeit locus 1 family protein